MITLSFIVYVIISLLIALYTYDNRYVGFGAHQNIRYRNKKKSLVYGFSYLPIAALSLTILISIITCVFISLDYSIKWILVNMP